MSLLVAGHTVQEAAARLGLSRSRVQALISTGQLAAENVGGRWIISTADLDRWERIPRVDRRPVAQTRAWQIIHEFETGHRALDDLESFRGVLAARSTAMTGRILPECLTLDDVPVEYQLGGPDAAAAHGAAVRAVVHDIYIPDTATSTFMAWSGFARVSAVPNIVLHVVNTAVWPLLAAGVGLVTAWLDLTDAGDRGAHEAMFTLRTRHDART